MTTAFLDRLLPRMTPCFRSIAGGTLLVWLALVARGQSDQVTPYSFTSLAGAVSAGSADGPGNVARFYFPSGIGVDSSGNVYVADTGNGTIRKIAPSGAVITLAGKAGAPYVPHTNLDGTGAAAWFGDPEGLAVDSSGIVFTVSDNSLRKITPAGVVTTTAGSLNGGELNVPMAVAIDGGGNIYIADTYHNAIRRTTVAGGPLSLVAGGYFGTADGTGSAAQFYNPSGIAVGPAGDIYVADTWNHTIRKISSAGVVTTFVGSAGAKGYGDGVAAAARFNFPAGLAVDAAGNLFVADSGNSVIRKVTPAGVVTTVAGKAGQDGHADGSADSAIFFRPLALALDAAGNLLVADSSNNTIRKITPGGVVTTIAGLSPSETRGNVDGIADKARFNLPTGICLGPGGSIFIADRFNNTVRKITSAGLVSTYAGADGKFSLPFNLTLSPSGSMYVADNTKIWRVAPDGAVSLFFDNLYEPSGCAFDSAGNLIVADSHHFVIRKIAPDGTGTVVAGSIGVRGYQDGTGGAARFGYMGSLAVDANDNVFLADYDNKAIRKITAAGVVTTFAGTTEYGATDGPGNVARFRGPWGLTLDAAGNVFVTDAGTVIRKISPTGVVSSVAGVPDDPGTIDGVGAVARFEGLGGIAVDASGGLYVVSGAPGASVIRKGTIAGAPVISTQPAAQTVAAGGSVQFLVTAGGEPSPTYQWYFNGAIFAGATTNALSFTNVRATDAGDYTVVVTNSLGSVTSNKATLTISAAPQPGPTAAGESNSGGGGGGSMTAWFGWVFTALLVMRLNFGRGRNLIAPEDK